MRSTFFSCLFLSPFFAALPFFGSPFGSSFGSVCYAEQSDMPVPFEAFGQENAVSLEFLKLYTENPQNPTIPADILAILQNQDSLEPPTIVRKASTSAVQDRFFPPSSLPAKISKPTLSPQTFPNISAGISPNIPMINEIAKDPALLHAIPLDELNKLILQSTDQYAGNMQQKNSLGLFSSPMQKSAPALPQISNLQNFRLVAAKQQVTDAAPNVAETIPATQQLKKEQLKKNKNSSAASALTEIRIDELEKKLAQGDKEAPFTLAYVYFYGTAEQKNPKRAISLMENLAKEGNTRAMVELGKMYEADSPDHNMVRSANYYKQAMEKGDLNGNYHLGLLYYKGKFGQGEEALKYAFYTFKEAADKEHAPCMYELATMYEKGAGFPKDLGQAVNLYRKSAHLGYAPAQMQVGLLYENGILVPKNETLAAAWYTKAAEQGFPPAEYLLAGMYRQGLGIPKNLKQAQLLYERAAQTGLVDAQYDLGIFYLLKSDFQDYKKAEYWLQKAADQNDMQAREMLLQVQQKSANPK